MEPCSLSLALRNIASAIDNSRNPSRELVAQDLHLLIYKLSTRDSIAGTKSRKLIDDIDKLAHDIIGSKRSWDYWDQKAKNIWGENTIGWDIVRTYLYSTYLVFCPSYPVPGVKGEHDLKVWATKAKNEWRKLTNDILNTDLKPIELPPFPIEKLKRSLLTDAYEAARNDIPRGRTMEFISSPIHETLRYLNVEHGESADKLLKKLDLEYTFPRPDELVNNRDKIISDLKSLMMNKIFPFDNKYDE